MKKILSAIILIYFLFNSFIYADEEELLAYQPTTTNIYGGPFGFPPGCTFYVDYTLGIINARMSTGSPTATFTATRSATTPSTYIDSSGIIQLVTSSNIPRFAGGYYDSTGFHAQKGVMIEAVATNLLIRTDGTASAAGLWTGWVKEETVVNDPTFTQVTAPTGISGSTAQRMQYVDGADVNSQFQVISTSTGAATVAPDNVVTFSIMARTQTSVTGANFIIQISWRDNVDALISTTNSATLTLTSSWKYFQLTGTAPALTDRVKVKIGPSSGVDQGDIVDFEIYAPQIEISPYATSFIPTTTAALTRNAETLTYPISGNRTAAQETIAIKFMPLGGSFANDGVRRVLTDTNTKSRIIKKTQTGTVITFLPNEPDNGAVLKDTTTVPLLNTSYVYTATCVNSPSSYAGYLNGTQEGTTGSTAWTLNTWGTNFYIGSNSSSTEQLNGLIQRVAIFNRALSASEVSAITTLLNQDT